MYSEGILTATRNRGSSSASIEAEQSWSAIVRVLAFSLTKPKQPIVAISHADCSVASTVAFSFAVFLVVAERFPLLAAGRKNLVPLQLATSHLGILLLQPPQHPLSSLVRRDFQPGRGLQVPPSRGLKVRPSRRLKVCPSRGSR
jgi:hypothetical protein